jgi:hypothetical protein
LTGDTHRFALAVYLAASQDQASEDRRSLGRLPAKRQHAVNISVRTRDDVDRYDLSNAFGTASASFHCRFHRRHVASDHGRS